MKVNWREVTAVFGGTFDPPHSGHVEAIEGLFKNPGVKRVLVIPTLVPPLKSVHTSFAHRRKMTELAFENTCAKFPVEILSLETSFTYDCLLKLKPKYGDLAWVIGTDQVPQLPEWHRFPDILRLCHWIVLKRNDEGTPTAIQAFKRLTEQGYELHLTPTPARAVSSSEIRHEFAIHGNAREGLIPIKVADYLKAEHLYGSK